MQGHPEGRSRPPVRGAESFAEPARPEGGGAWPGPHGGRCGAATPGGERAEGRGSEGSDGASTPKTECPVRDPAACVCAATHSLCNTPPWNAAGKSIGVGPAPAEPALKAGSFLRFVHSDQGSFLQPVPSPSTCLRHALQMSLALSLQSRFSASGLPALKAECFSCNKWF